MNSIYRGPLRLYINFFQASKKCIAKIREVYDEPKTPYQRLMERDDVPQETKEKLRELYLSLNPVDLLIEIYRLLELLGVHGGWEEPEKLAEYLLKWSEPLVETF